MAKKTSTSSNDEARFRAWLVTGKGAAVTAVPGETDWNLSVARAATDRVTGKNTTTSEK